MKKFLTLKKEGGKKMKKLFYIKCDDFICDVTDTYLSATELLKEYQLDDPSSKFKVQYTRGTTEIVITKFNQDRMKKFLSLTKEAA
tara:strand:- start:145 stop:402 length:258 start_codon:yes stop_codon:yes gene_type:complete